MLTRVEVRSPRGAQLNLPLASISSGIVVQDIQGLEPGKATVVSSSFANMDGAQFHSSRREPRNIKLTLGMESGYGSLVQDIRSTLYNFFMPKSRVDLRFVMSNGLSADISGRVESFEAPLFTKEPKADISILCFDPDLLDIVPVILTGSTVADLTETLVEYEGTVETGILFTLNVDRTITEFTIYHRPPDDSLRTLDFAASMVAGDILRINTVPGSKSVTITRAGVTSSILYGMSPQANWIELRPGENSIRVYALGAPIPYEITYTNRLGGL